jgi:archaellum component FlaC
LKEELKGLEARFKEIRMRYKEITQMKELIQIQEVKQILDEIADRKKKVQKLEYAMQDALKET